MLGEINHKISIKLHKDLFLVSLFPLSVFGEVCIMAGSGGLMSAIRTPLGVVLLLIIILVLAGLTIASSISGELTAAAVSSAGLIVIVVLLVIVNTFGK